MRHVLASLAALLWAFAMGLLTGHRWGREDGRREMAALCERLMELHGKAARSA